MKHIITAIFIFIGVTAFAGGVSAATATGTITSAIKNIGMDVNWKTASWTASTSASSTIDIKFRSGTTSDMASASVWTACATTSSGADLSAEDCVTDGHRYIQYQALLTMNYATATEFMSPELQDITIKYEAAGILVSSVYNTLADDTVISEVRWSESLPGSSDALIQLRSSSDGSSWTSWLGSGGTIEDYFTDFSGGESIPAVFSDGAGEQYLQYRIILDSGGSDLPVLSDITIDYTASVPIITSVSPAYLWSTASGTMEVTLSGSGFVSGAALSVLSGGSTLVITDKSVNANSVVFNIDSALLFGGTAVITVTNTNGAAVSWSDFYVNNYVGSLVSRVIDIPNLYFNAFSWTAVTTATSSVSFKARSDTASDMSGATAWASCGVLTSGNDISAETCVTDGRRYLQYRAELTAVYGTSSDWITPELKEVIIGYARWAATGTLVSSPYDSGSAANALSKIYWTESAPDGTDVLFQVRTAPDAVGSPGSWSAWFGLYETDGYYRNPGGQSGLYLSQTDGVSDQWVQYRAYFESDGRSTPTLSDITIDYGSKQYSTTIINDNVIFKDGAIFR